MATLTKSKLTKTFPGIVVERIGKVWVIHRNDKKIIAKTLPAAYQRLCRLEREELLEREGL